MRGRILSPPLNVSTSTLAYQTWHLDFACRDGIEEEDEELMGESWTQEIFQVTFSKPTRLGYGTTTPRGQSQTPRDERNSEVVGPVEKRRYMSEIFSADRGSRP